MLRNASWPRHTTSSKRSPPRRPAITTDRSAADHVTVPTMRGCPANSPKRSHSGAASAYASSSRPTQRSTLTSSSPSRRLNTIAPTRHPRPRHPQTVQPRSSRHAAQAPPISPRQPEARRARASNVPPTRAIQPRRRPRLPQQRQPAPRTRRRATRRAPLLEPSRAVAHDSSPISPTPTTQRPRNPRSRRNASPAPPEGKKRERLPPPKLKRADFR
jgi:hypothetical protein